jgi:hypothetical protein
MALAGMRKVERVKTLSVFEGVWIVMAAKRVILHSSKAAFQSAKESQRALDERTKRATRSLGTLSQSATKMETATPGGPHWQAHKTWKTGYFPDESSGASIHQSACSPTAPPQIGWCCPFRSRQGRFCLGQRTRSRVLSLVQSGPGTECVSPRDLLVERLLNRTCMAVRR